MAKNGVKARRRSVQCDQIGLFLEGLGKQILFQKKPKYLLTFAANLNGITFV